MTQPSEDESIVQDTLTIKKKGRPEKEKRWKGMVEQEREKAKKAQQKKSKKAETSSKEIFKKVNFKE
jgi:3'-phosphoadenosine 5'-phosphosulfate sulfotransferase (PAPS reductase)/FAD synthetase